MKEFKLLTIASIILFISWPNVVLGQDKNSKKIDGSEFGFTPSLTEKYSKDFLEEYNRTLKKRAIVYNQTRVTNRVGTHPNPVGTCNLMSCGSFNLGETTPDNGWGGFRIAVDGSTYAANVEYDCWDDHGTVDYSEGQYISYSNSDANIDTPAIISSSPDGGGFSIFSYRNEAITQNITVLPNANYTVCFEIAVIPRYSNDDGDFVEFVPNLRFGIESGGIQIPGGDALEYTHNDLTIHPLSDFPTELSTNTTGAFQNPGGWTEINPYWETVCITFKTDNSGQVEIYYRTGDPGRSVILVDGLRLSLEGYAIPPTLDPISINTPRIFCDPTSVDLEDYITPNGPGGSVLTWSTDVDPLVVSAHLSNTVVNVPGTYYAFYYNSADNCASPAVQLDLELTNLSYAIDSQTDVNCSGNGGASGEIVVSGVDGTSPYTYSIDGGSTSQNDGTFSNLTSGTYQILITDDNGCLVTTSDININTIDSIDPVITAPDDYTIENCDISDVYNLPYSSVEVVITLAELEAALGGNGTASDDSNNFVITYIDTCIDFNACPIIVNRTFTITDVCGNTATDVQTVTVTDTTAPTFNESLPTTVEVECDNVPDPVVLTASDNCGVATVTFEEMVEQDAYGSCINNYRLIRIWTATDACGLVTEHRQIIRVHDTTAPTFNETLPTDITSECDNVPTAATLTASDNCGTADVTFTETRTDGSCANDYTLTRVWTATDECGLTTEHTQVVTVTDTTAPIFNESLPVDIAVECDSIPTADTLTASDNCGTADVTFTETRTDGSCANDYTLTRVWTATDECGLTTEHTQTVTVTDTTAPTFNEVLPVDITSECDNVPTADTLTASDNCGTADVTFTETRTDGTCANDYTLTRVWTATDECGLTTEHTQTVTVTDTTAPELADLPEEQITVTCNEIPDVADIVATDICGSDVTMTFEEIETVPDVDGNYTITRDWVFTDVCGNESAFTQIINVEAEENVLSTELLSICIDDLSIDLFTLLVDGIDTSGTWNDVNGTGGLINSIFDPIDVELGDYLITYSFVEGCTTNVIEIIVNVNDECVVLPADSPPCDLIDLEDYISKAVTPNGDGYNDTFVVGAEAYFGCGYTFDIKIFNRWGQVVFESTNYQDEWDGLHMTGGITIGSTNDLPSGTYYYILNVLGGERKSLSGPLYLGK